jgi:hypothetical protein
MAFVSVSALALFAFDPPPNRQFLALVAVFSFDFVFSGYRVLSRKRPTDGPEAVDWLVPGPRRSVVLERPGDPRPERLVDREGHVEFLEERVHVRPGQVGRGPDPQHAELAVDGCDLHALEEPRLEQEADGRRDEPARQRGREPFGRGFGFGHRPIDTISDSPGSGSRTHSLRARPASEGRHSPVPPFPVRASDTIGLDPSTTAR